MITIAELAREEDRRAQREMWGRLNPPRTLPRGLPVALTALSLLALGCIGTAVMALGVADGWVR